jgi:hypothetical protein
MKKLKKFFQKKTRLFAAFIVLTGITITYQNFIGLNVGTSFFSNLQMAHADSHYYPSGGGNDLMCSVCEGWANCVNQNLTEHNYQCAAYSPTGSTTGGTTGTTTGSTTGGGGGTNGIYFPLTPGQCDLGFCCPICAKSCSIFYANSGKRSMTQVGPKTCDVQAVKEKIMADRTDAAIGLLTDRQCNETLSGGNGSAYDIAINLKKNRLIHDASGMLVGIKRGTTWDLVDNCLNNKVIAFAVEIMSNPSIELCSSFFSLGPDEQILVILHEVGHIAKTAAEEIQKTFTGMTDCDDMAGSFAYDDYIIRFCPGVKVTPHKILTCR